MLFDADTEQLIQEVIMHKWNTEWDPELKAEILQIAHGLNCSWMDVVMACIQADVEDLENPIARRSLMAGMSDVRARVSRPWNNFSSGC